MTHAVSDEALVTDVLFLLEVANAAPVAFDHVKNYVSSLIASSFDVDNLLTRVGVIVYSDRARAEIHLNDYTSLDELKEAVLGLTYLNNGNVNHGEALQTAIDHGFSEVNGARDGVRKVLFAYLIFCWLCVLDSIKINVSYNIFIFIFLHYCQTVIIITDDNVDQRNGNTLDIARRLRNGVDIKSSSNRENDDVAIFAVCVGWRVSSSIDMERLTGNPDHLVYVDTYADLSLSSPLQNKATDSLLKAISNKASKGRENSITVFSCFYLFLFFHRSLFSVRQTCP